ncbi:MAG: hypothetical protein AAFY88_13785 [Acidobacteriota bacterium]
MNFFFHRHLAERDLGSAAAGLGAMLPDLWRMADRRMRAKAGVQLLTPVGLGVEHHLEMDAWFHHRPIFLDGQAATGKAFAQVQAPRMRLFAHVAWEMCLDGALVRALGVDAALRDLRRSLGWGLDDLMEEAVRAHRPRIGDEPLARLLTRLRELLDSLERGEWVAGYAEPAGLVRRLEGVRRRFDFDVLPDGARWAAEAAFADLLDLAAGRLDEMLAGSLGVATVSPDGAPVH